MKRLGLIAMLGMLVGVSACKSVSEIENPEGNILKEETVIRVVYEADHQTKTVLQENGDVWWKPNDAIGVFFGPYCSTFHAYNMEDASAAYFIGNALIIQGNAENSDGKPGAYSYWGVFPPELSNPYTADQEFDYWKGNTDYDCPTREKESVNVYLPARQKGVAGTFDSNSFISIAQSSDYKELSFYNLCGGLAFCVEREGIHTVIFSGNAGETLAGKVNVVMNSEGRPVVNEVLNGKTEVTLAMKKGEYFIPGEWYYIVMLPAVLEEGYTMEFYGNRFAGETKTSSPVEIKRSVFGRLTNPDADMETRPVAEIVIDSDFSDWDALDPSLVSVATCAPDARWTALKTLKACANDYAVYIYFEFVEEEILDRAWTPVHIFIDADNNSKTGGCGLQYAEACSDWILEGGIFEDDAFCSYDAALYPWVGEPGANGWYWGDSLCAGFTSGAGNDAKYEIMINKELCPDVEFAETFGLGVSILQNWESVGVLPNADMTEGNPSGRAPLLKVGAVNADDEPSDEPEVQTRKTLLALASKVDGQGNMTSGRTFRYDDNGLLVGIDEVWTNDKGQLENWNLNVTRNGNVLTFTTDEGEVEYEWEVNEKGYVVKKGYYSYEYDAEDHLVKVIEDWGEGPHVVSICTWENGNMVSWTKEDEIPADPANPEGEMTARVKRQTYKEELNVGGIFTVFTEKSSLKRWMFEAGFFGKPSKNLVATDKWDHYSDGTPNETGAEFEYRTDDDGYVVAEIKYYGGEFDDETYYIWK